MSDNGSGRDDVLARIDNIRDTMESKIKEQVDARADSIRDGIELRLKEQIDEHFNKRFDQFIKVLYGVLGALAILFSVLGITSYGQFNNVVQDAAIKQVRNQLAFDDPNSKFHRQVNEVVTRSIVDSYLISITRLKAEGSHRFLYLEPQDFERLVQELNEPDTTVSDFLDICAVLGKTSQQTKSRASEVLLSTIHELAAAEEPKSAWITAEPGKRAALFDLDKDEELVEAAQKILAQDANPELLIAAANYVRRVHAGSDVVTTSLQKLVANANHGVSRSALDALAVLSPESRVLGKQIESMLKQAEDDDMIEAVHIAQLMTESLDAAGDAKFRLDQGTKIIATFADKGFLLQTWSGRLEISKSADLGNGGGNDIDADILRNRVLITEVLKRAAGQPDVFARRLNALIPYGDDGNARAAVMTVSLSDGAEIVVENEPDVTSKTAESVTLAPDLAAGLPPKVKASWTSSGANTHEAELKAIVKPDSVQFKLKLSSSVSNL